MTEIKKLVRVGGSWAVTISPAILRYLGIRPRDLVSVSLLDHSIVIRRLDWGRLRAWMDQEEAGTSQGAERRG